MSRAAAADHHRELALVVDLLRHRRAGQAHRVVRPITHSGSLVKTIGHGVLGRQAGAEHAVGELGGVRAVVAADAEDAAQRPGQRRSQRDRLDRQARGRRRRAAARPRASISISGSAPRAASATASGVASRPSADIVPTWARPPQLQLAMRICLSSPLSRGRSGKVACAAARSMVRFETCVSNTPSSHHTGSPSGPHKRSGALPETRTNPHGASQAQADPAARSPRSAA